MIGLFVTSKAGHDKGCLYIVLKEERDYVWVADGKYRLVDSLKKKNKKHIQPIVKKIDQQIYNQISSGIVPTDEEIKRAIKLYCMD